MTNYYYKTMTVTHKDPRQFGGIIFQSDYETDYRGKDNNNGSIIANRIMSDRKFDEQCIKNILSKQRSNSYKENKTRRIK